jgi:DNA integrity scanning protein DisA with diadenylate cyclase activity
VEKTVCWSLFIITLDFSSTFCLGLVLYLVDHRAAAELTPEDNSVSTVYALLFVADIVKILVVNKYVLEPTPRNTGALPDIISRQMVWVYKGVLILLFVARVCQLFHLLWNNDRNLRQLFTTVAVIALVVIVVHQIKFLEERPEFAHPNVSPR